MTSLIRRQMPKRWVNISLRRRTITAVDLILGMAAAAATALPLALIARDAVGMPPDTVREDALIAASVVITIVAGMASRRRTQ
jgi:hypothetical protein